MAQPILIVGGGLGGLTTALTLARRGIESRVLLGDAAHAPLQSLAHGACMAIEDGFCLGELIHAGAGDYASAFQKFEQARLLRTARVQLESRALWPFYHAGGIEREVRNEMMAPWDEEHMFNCLAWLYDGAPPLK
jgi:salicylate hydroxylase